MKSNSLSSSSLDHVLMSGGYQHFRSLHYKLATSTMIQFVIYKFVFYSVMLHSLVLVLVSSENVDTLLVKRKECLTFAS